MFLPHALISLELTIYHVLSIIYDHFMKKYWLAHELLFPLCVINEVMCEGSTNLSECSELCGSWAPLRTARHAHTQACCTKYRRRLCKPERKRRSLTRG